MKNKSKVNSNMNLHNSLANAQKGATDSIKKRDNEAMRDMNKTMQSSRAKTRRDIIMKSQHLADKNFDARLHFKGECLCHTLIHIPRNLTLNLYDNCYFMFQLLFYLAHNAS